MAIPLFARRSIGIAIAWCWGRTSTWRRSHQIVVPNRGLDSASAARGRSGRICEFLAGLSGWNSSRNLLYHVGSSVGRAGPFPTRRFTYPFRLALSRNSVTAPAFRAIGGNIHSVSAKSDAYPPRSALRGFRSRSLWHANYANGAFFKDKIVIVGRSAQIAHDFVATPMEPDTPGPPCICRRSRPRSRANFSATLRRQTNFSWLSGRRHSGLGAHRTREAATRLLPGAARGFRGLPGVCPHRL